MSHFPKKSVSDKLTYEKLLQLSENLNKDQLRTLAIKGLKMAGDKIDPHLYDNSSDIKTAVYNFLKEWRDSQENEKSAYSNICEALERAEMPLKINILQCKALQSNENHLAT